MVLRMTRPTRRPDTSFLWYRKRVPAGVRKAAHGQCVAVTFPSEVPGAAPLVVHSKLGEEVHFSLRTRDPALAKERIGLANTQLDRMHEAIRNGPRPAAPKASRSALWTCLSGLC